MVNFLTIHLMKWLFNFRNLFLTIANSILQQFSKWKHGKDQCY